MNSTASDGTNSSEPSARTERSDDTQRTGAPAWLIWVMIVVASLIAVGSGLNTWLNRQLLSTDAWVETADDLLADDEVRLALSTFLVDELYDTVDVSGDLGSRLPDGLDALAAPIAAAIRTPAIDGVDRLLATEQARSVWEQINRTAHEALVALLHDETREGVSTAGGAITLELGPLVTAAGVRIGLPDTLLDRLPPDAGQIVIFESDELAAAQDAVRVIDFLAAFLLVVVVALYAAAVFLARDRRTTLRNVGWALAVSGLLMLVIRGVGVHLATDDLAAAPDVRSAVGAIADIATNLMNQLGWVGIVIGLLVALYAMLIGPAPTAVAIRRAAAPVLSNAAATWLVAAALVLVLVALLPGLAARSWVAGLVLVVLFVAAVEGLRRQSLRELPAP